MADLDNVEETIQATREALNEIPEDHHDRAFYLDILGVAFGDRHSITDDPADLDIAVQLSSEAVNMTPEDSPDRAERLNNHAIRLAERYSIRSEITDLENAIRSMRQVVNIIPKDDPDKAMYLNNLGTALGDQYLQTKRIDYLNESIQITQEAIDAAVEDHSDQAMYMNNLGLRLGDRYLRTGETADLESAISIIREAINLTPEDSSDRSLYLNTLSIELGYRYSNQGAEADLEESVQVAQETVAAIPQNHPDRAMYLNNLGLALGQQYLASNAISDVENATLAIQEALDITPEGSSDWAMYLSNVSTQLGRRYSRTGVIADLEESIRNLQTIQFTLRDHPNRADWLSNLGVRLNDRYLRTGSVANLQEAIRVTQEAVNTALDPTDKATYLRNLGNQLAERYSRIGATADIHDALKALQQAISASVDPIERAMCLTSLGNRLGDRYDAEGTITYLEESIDFLQQAVDLTPEHHSTKASHLSNLGIRLAARYSSTGAITDLESAIQVMRRVVNMTPQKNPRRALFLHNLGSVLGDRYIRTKTMVDLEQAIQVAEEAASMTPQGHPNKPMYLNGLAIWLGDRYSRSGTMSDLDGTIHAAKEAVNAVPDGHSERPAYLNNLGVQLLERCKKTMSMTGLEDAIRFLQEAVDMRAESHPSKAMYLINLGTGLDYRCSITGQIADHEGALSQFQSALSNPNSPTIDRIASGIAILRICASISDWQQACDTSEITVDLIPKLTSRHLDNSDRQHLLSQVVGLASNAAAAALHAGRAPIVALKFLEQGRGVLATSLEEMRMDIIDLQAKYPELAKQFTRLRGELDHPITRSTFLSDEYNVPNHQLQASRRYNAGNELDKLIVKIRESPGFEDFLTAPGEADMRAAAKCGPIIFINVSEYRCDAILVEQHQIRSLALPDLKSRDAMNWAQSSNVKKSQMLEWLWDAVARPVLDALGFTQPPSSENWPRVWWIATGALTKLPIHAAGRHGNGSAETVLDRVMSSYAPSIKAIIYGRRRAAPVATFSVSEQAVLVDMQDTPGQSSLHFATKEVAMIYDLCKLIGLEPVKPGRRKRDIIPHLSKSRIFHFAGHGRTDNIDPSQSQLLLEDWMTDSFTVATLLDMNIREHAPFMAYLSACGTGQIKNEKFFDESIHLISAAQLAGFRHVIGTLWEVNDESCVDMAMVTYEGMRDGGMTDDSVCRGLHNATRRLRDRWLSASVQIIHKRDISLGDTTNDWSANDGDKREDGLPRDVDLYDDKETRPLHWVPYVHFGV
ncbi:CHAT domain-containing protein [Xylariaceae sp. AK1471]|nr:CHAT domain-containing protein [Xylariaceae sp. AK1471]